MMPRLKVGPLLVLSFSFAACAAPSASDDAEGSEAAVVAGEPTGCTGQDLDDAKTLYEHALGNARRRVESPDAICEEDPLTADQGSLESDLTQAVAACADYRRIIAESPEAAPIRTSLSTSLTLPLLTGALVPGDDWRGLEAALAGSEIYGPAPGAFGNEAAMSLSADRTLTFVKVFNEDTGLREERKSGTWKVSREGSSAVVAVTVDGTTTRYVFNAIGFEGTNIVQLEIRPEDASGESAAWFTYPAECG